MTAARSRSRTSAKKAGASFETVTAGFLNAHVDDRIERRARNGAKDRGDISGLRTPHGGRLVVEVKNTARVTLGPWAAEAAIEMGNDDALAAVIVHKRHGKSDPAAQWVTCTLADFVAILTGSRPGLAEDDLMAIAEDRLAEITQDANDGWGNTR